MKTLSIRQPWPWLILRPDVTDPGLRRGLKSQGLIKDVENRSWPTSFRGPFLVHAGQTFDEQGYWVVKNRFPSIPLPSPTAFERGGIVGQVTLRDCTDYYRSRWFAGPMGFVLEDPRPLPFRRCRGKLGFFEVDPRELFLEVEVGP